MAQPLRDLALALGLEDDIPLFEIAQTSLMAQPELSSDEVISQLSEVLIGLLHEGRIAVYEGPCQADSPRRIYGSAAVELLADVLRYRFENEEAFGLDRVYFVNMDNIAD